MGTRWSKGPHSLRICSGAPGKDRVSEGKEEAGKEGNTPGVQRQGPGLPHGQTQALCAGLFLAPQRCLYWEIAPLKIS